MEIEFKIVGEIKTKQRPRATVIGGHARVYTPKDTLYYENYVRNCYKEEAKDYYFGDKPIIANITAYYKAPDNIRKLAGYERVACCCHQDLDNLAKTILDSLNGVAYDDDKQITYLICEKKYSSTDREYVVVKLMVDSEYMTLDDLKQVIAYNKNMDRYNELIHKDKLTKAEKQRIEQLKEILFKEAV